MANSDSQTNTPKHNPQKSDQAPPLPPSGASLPDHLDAFGDALKAFRWSLAIRPLSGSRVDERVFEVQTMVEALRGEMEKLLDPLNFGEPGNVLEEPCVYDKAYRLQGLLYLLDMGLYSINLEGDAGYPSESLDPPGIERLFNLICKAFGDLRAVIAREMERHTSGADLAH